jgi:hypothetical protein
LIELRPAATRRKDAVAAGLKLFLDIGIENF